MYYRVAVQYLKVTHQCQQMAEKNRVNHKKNAGLSQNLYFSIISNSVAAHFSGLKGPIRPLRDSCLRNIYKKSTAILLVTG